MSPSHARLFPRRGGRSRIPHSGLRLLSAPADLAGRLEHAEALDRVAQPLTRAALRALVPAGARADALHGVWLGQPVHPALVTLPLGCWTSAAVLDFVPGTERASRVLLALGLAGALPAAAAGLADWSSLHREQQRVGLAHAASAPAPRRCSPPRCSPGWRAGTAAAGCWRSAGSPP